MENDYDNHFNQAEEAYKNNDYIKAFQSYQPLAKLGHVQAHLTYRFDGIQKLPNKAWQKLKIIWPACIFMVKGSKEILWRPCTGTSNLRIKGRPNHNIISDLFIKRAWGLM